MREPLRLFLASMVFEEWTKTDPIASHKSTGIVTYYR